MADVCGVIGRFTATVLGGLLSVCITLTVSAAEQSAPSDAAHQLLTFIDHTGRPLVGLPGQGQYRLVYFGYSHCPDVCPTDLHTMSAAMLALGPDAERIQPIFITVDPQRDTPEAMAQYVKYFHPRLVGLTGTSRQITAAKRRYGVRAMKFFPLPPEDDSRELSQAQDNAQYVFNHTAFTYLLNLDGEVVERFERAGTIAEMVKRVRTHLASN